MVGIDVSKHTLVCAVTDDETRVPLARGEFANNVEGVRELLRWAPAQATFVLEPTGRYSLLAVEEVTATGRIALLAPPREAKYFNRSVNSRAKTDPIDSFGLALFGLSRNLRPFSSMSDTQDQLTQLLSARRLMSHSVARMVQQRAELPLARAALGSAIADMKRQVLSLDREISRLTADAPDLRCARDLQRVHGVGAVSAAAMATRLGSRGFVSADQFVAFVGLDVRIVQSGKRKGDLGLTKQGDAELRRLLYCCAMAAIRTSGSPFRAQYEREMAKQKMTRTAALCAVARKIARVCWAIHTRQVPYDPARVYQAPVASGSADASADAPAMTSAVPEASRDASDA
jgi:transposase